MFERYPAILAIIDGTMNSALYQNILKENVRPSVCDLKLKHTWVMQQDNEPKHTSQSNSEWLKKNKINVFEWPSQNPIEILWHDLKHSFHSWKPSSEAEFHVVPGRFGQLFSLSKLHFYFFYVNVNSTEGWLLLSWHLLLSHFTLSLYLVSVSIPHPLPLLHFPSLGVEHSGVLSSEHRARLSEAGLFLPHRPKARCHGYHHTTDLTLENWAAHPQQEPLAAATQLLAPGQGYFLSSSLWLIRWFSHPLSNFFINIYKEYIMEAENST